MNGPERPGLLARTIRFCLENPLVVFLVLALVVGGGLYVMPFERAAGGFPSDPIPVDAFPDLGDNQQIVFTDWPGRSPQDVEDQVTVPLSAALQGVPGVRTIRANSMFGFSIVRAIFEDRYDFYWCRSRVLERLAVAARDLPEGVLPSLGPDATSVSQIFWYTVEGEGFDLQELRSIQDWTVRYALLSVPGVAEVAAVGGYVKEYQIDVDPDAMRAQRVTLAEIFEAVRRANIDVGAETIEWNGVEYVVRGRGFVRGVEDLEHIVVRSAENVPIYLRNVARIHLGPALRRGALDKEGAEAVGAVVVTRYGANPLEVLREVKAKIAALAPSLPAKALDDGRNSRVKIVPFYDRTDLIRETLGTLETALVEEALVTIFVVLLLLGHFRSNLLIASNLPLAVLLAFVGMKLAGVDSNLMSLGGIAIAIGTLVDMGIVLAENVVRHFEEASPEEKPLEVIYRATTEVGGAVLTSITVTVLSFLPVFGLTGAEGKLFRPLAFTKTFALLASVVVALTVLPALAHVLFSRRATRSRWVRWSARGALLPLGVLAAATFAPVGGTALALAGVFLLVERRLPGAVARRLLGGGSFLAALVVLFYLTKHWMPLGLDGGLGRNVLFVFGINLAWSSVRLVVIRWYPAILSFLLRHKAAFLGVTYAVTVFGLVVWLGFDRVFSFVPATLEKAGVPQAAIRGARPWVAARHAFPGMGREFMPALDEGSFLFMPTTMPHASIGEALDILSKQDRAIAAIPEVESVVGKIGRVESPLDPAPLEMVETVVAYRPEYGPPDPETGKRERLWRDHVRTPDDIWKEILAAAEVPGSTSAPKLQPIAARLVMLQTGMRSPMGVKVFGPTLEAVEAGSEAMARALAEVPSIAPETIVPDRVIGKPYLEIEIDRERIARYGVNTHDVQDVIEIAIGGKRATTTVEGRERYPIRVRYLRERRDDPESLGRILVPASAVQQVPLAELARIEFVRGPQEIKSEDFFLVAYVPFDKRAGAAEVEVVEEAKRVLEAKRESGDLVLPDGVFYRFAGTYEHQIRFQERLKLLLPLSLLLIFLVLYLQFRSTLVAMLVFHQVFVVWGAAFVFLWLVGQGWFLDLDVLGRNLRDLFHFGPTNLSVSVWVGFLALFGIAVNDAVVITTYLNQVFEKEGASSVADVRRLVVLAGQRRVRPCLMTTATTVLALLPVLTSSGRGADVMIPLALPIVGGMTFELLTLYVTPVAYSLWKEARLRHA